MSTTRHTDLDRQSPTRRYRHSAVSVLIGLSIIGSVCIAAANSEDLRGTRPESYLPNQLHLKIGQHITICGKFGRGIIGPYIQFYPGRGGVVYIDPKGAKADGRTIATIVVKDPAGRSVSSEFVGLEPVSDRVTLDRNAAIDHLYTQFKEGESVCASGVLGWSETKYIGPKDCPIQIPPDHFFFCIKDLKLTATSERKHRDR